jgi:dTDP-4-amino-4,6-dideoxygalactose transaminase
MILARGEGGSCLGALTGALPAQAAIGRRQLTKLDEWVRIRRKGMPLWTHTHADLARRGPFGVRVKIAMVCSRAQDLGGVRQVARTACAARGELCRESRPACGVRCAASPRRRCHAHPSVRQEHSYYRLYAFVQPDALHPGWTRDRHGHLAIRAVQSCNHRTVTTSLMSVR